MEGEADYICTGQGVVSVSQISEKDPNLGDWERGGVGFSGLHLATRDLQGMHNWLGILALVTPNMA